MQKLFFPLLIIISFIFNSFLNAVELPNDLKVSHTVDSTGTIEIAFSPKGGITQMIVKELESATNSIEVQAYTFTSAPIAKALIDAQKRGVNVRVILDKSQEREKFSPVTLLTNAGIKVHIDRDFSIAHSKIMIIDDLNFITGSFNFSKAAEYSNAENCLIIRGNKKLVDLYKINWNWRWNNTR